MCLLGVWIECVGLWEVSAALADAADPTLFVKVLIVRFLHRSLDCSD
jgi:hypothetical protein